MMNRILIFWSLLWVCGTGLAQALSWLTPAQREIGLIPNDSVTAAKLSANGQFLTFTSRASNFVSDDSNRVEDLFIKNLQNGEVRRINTLSNGQFATDGEIRAFTRASDNGRFVSFSTDASIFPHHNGDFLVYTKDLQSGEIIVESLYDNGLLWSESENRNVDGSLYLSIDGRYLTFKSEANLDSNPLFEPVIFRKDRLNQSYQLVSISDTAVAAEAQLSAMSRDGRFILFHSGAAVLTGVTGNHLYLRDMAFATTVVVNVNTLGEPSPGGVAFENAFHGVSDAGDVVYCTHLDDLVVGDNNGFRDVFLYKNGVNQRISLTSSGLEISDGGCQENNSRISADGSMVVFSHGSSQIDPLDTNSAHDYFQYNVNTGNSQLLTQHQDGAGYINDFVVYPDLSANGAVITFSAVINGLITTSLTLEHAVVYVYDQSTGTLDLATPAAFEPTTLINHVASPKISDDQQWVIYTTTALNANPDEMVNGFNQENLFLLNRFNDEVNRVGDDIVSGQVDMSPNGRFMVFVSPKFQPISTIELNELNVFLYDRLSGQHIQIAAGVNPRVNNEGNVVFTSSASDLVPGDNNGFTDVFIYDHDLQSIGRVSEGLNGQEANGVSFNPDIGGSGISTWVVFESVADNLVVGDVSGMNDVFLINWPGGQTIRVSEDVVGGDDDSSVPVISEDSSTIAFVSDAQNLTADDYTDVGSQVLLYDRVSGLLAVASLDLLGQPVESGVFESESSLSNDGKFVSFASIDSGLVAQDINGAFDLFVFDRLTQTTQRVSQFVDGEDISQSTFGGQVVVDNSVNPPLLGVVMSASAELLLDDPTAIYYQGYLYQSGGPGVSLNMQIIGGGQVTGNLGYQCSQQCSDVFFLGATVDLIALPEVGYVFQGWSGEDCQQDEQQCQLTMNEEKHIQAVFLAEDEIIFSHGFEG